MENNVSIYRLTCHGRVYIGQTNNVHRRVQVYKKGRCYGQRHLLNAIKLYGWEAFTLDILEDGLTREQANKREIELISHYRSADRQFGFNLSLGGQAGNHSEETKQKIGSTNAKNYSTPEARQVLSDRLKTYRCTPEFNQRLSEGGIARFNKEEERLKQQARLRESVSVDIPEFAIDHRGRLSKVIDKYTNPPFKSAWHKACYQKYTQLAKKRRFWLNEQERTRVQRLGLKGVA